MSMLVALHRGEGVIARAIRWQTRSVYSHASIVLEGTGSVIEAREFQGVRWVRWDEVVASGESIDLFRVKGLTPEAEAVVLQFLWDQMGKPYDYTMVARFISRRQAAREESGKWFCSELVFAALAKAGVKLLERIEPWEVSPGVLRLSTRLEECEWPQKGTEGAKRGNIEHPTSNSEHREWGVEASSRLGVKAEASLRTPKEDSSRREEQTHVGPVGTVDSLERLGCRQDTGSTLRGDWTGGGACPTTEGQTRASALLTEKEEFCDC